MKSPNIWEHTATYELENHAADPDGRLWTALEATGPWEGRDLLDLGCGAGYHLPGFAARARSVTGVEPHPGLAAIAARRTRKLAQVTVLGGLAQEIPLPDASVDVVHVRWAYFFGPGCEPGLAELDRVLRRGGVAMIVDNDPTRSTFGAWFRRGFPHLPPPGEVERFWSTRGWTRVPIDMGWRFTSRADLEAVVRIELPGPVADEALRHWSQADGLEIDYAVNLWWRRF